MKTVFALVAALAYAAALVAAAEEPVVNNVAAESVPLNDAADTEDRRYYGGNRGYYRGNYGGYRGGNYGYGGRPGHY